MLLNPLEIDFFGESSLTNLIKRTSLIIIKTMNIEENKIKIISLGILAKFVVTASPQIPTKICTLYPKNRVDTCETFVLHP
jgi:hypothetical protein